MKNNAFLIGFILIILLGACDSNTIIDKNVNINNKEWLHSDKPSFNIHISDISKKYDVWLNVRHTAKYPYSNLFVLVHEKGPKTKEYSYRKALKLAEADGKWTGKSAGSLYTQRSLIHQNYTFPDTGIYQFIFEQNMRDNPLVEISDVGLNIMSK
ncbi:gliding motility lipoprotein GldH [Sphingobacterium anhuiense]|uniref:Gliding motility lipoprotein GldH n=1 Tax=Sphingobacterium anhuiense TaxID=493780 RepID=A0ABW5Z1T9_9SPHI